MDSIYTKNITYKNHSSLQLKLNINTENQAIMATKVHATLIFLLHSLLPSASNCFIIHTYTPSIISFFAPAQ